MAALTPSAELATATDFNDFLRKLRDARTVILQSKNEAVDSIEDTEFPVVREQIANVCAVLEHKSDAFAIATNCSLTSEALLSLCRDTFSPFESLCFPFPFFEAVTIDGEPVAALRVLKLVAFPI